MKTTLKTISAAVPPSLLLIAALALSVFTLTRIVLAIYTGTDLPLTLWPLIIAKGFCFDIAVISVLMAPFCLYEALAPARPRSGGRYYAFKAVFLWGLTALLLFIAVSEVTFWLEFSTRFNFIAVDYLLYTTEVIGNIRESYPIDWILISIGLISAGIVWATRRIFSSSGPAPVTRAGRIGYGLAALLLPALGAAAVNIDQMQGSGNAYADELSGNGIMTFAAAFRRNELDYDKFYKTMPQELADATLKPMAVKRSPLSAALKSDMNDEADDPSPFRKPPRNVVLITVESLSASFLGAYGSTQGLTPNLDRLAREGLKFERVFATGTRTVRGLEALSLGTPPVPGQAIVRRPANDHLSTVGQILSRQGFYTAFIYGGYGYFDNMNAYFRGNDSEITDQRDFPAESVIFKNIWGVADEVLYDNALAVIDRNVGKKPVFAHLMSTSNHRPYTYPDGRIDIPSPGGRAGAVKYSDYAIGRFINAAKKKPWFKDTLFVIVADHCASAAGKTRLPVGKYRIPLIFYAPALLQPGTYAQMVSQIDLAPTLIEILGKKGDDHFFGRAFFEKGENPERAFISNYQELGYLRNGLLTVLEPNRRVESFRIDPISYEATPADVDQRLLREAIAYYQTAARAFKRGALRVSAP